MLIGRKAMCILNLRVWRGVAARGDLPLYHRSRDASCTFRGMEHKTRLIISSEPGHPTYLNYSGDMSPGLRG